MRLFGRNWVSLKVVSLKSAFAVILLPIGIMGAAFHSIFWNVFAIWSRPLWRFRPKITTVRTWCRRVRPSRNVFRDGLLPQGIHPPPRVLLHIPVNAWAVHQPQWIGFQVTPRGRIVIPHPVLMQPRLTLEPLAGEAVGRKGTGRSVDRAERGVGGGPDFCAAGVGGERWTADVVGADEADHPAFDHRDGIPAVPDIFAEQSAGGFGLCCTNRLMTEVTLSPDGLIPRLQ